MRKSKGKSPSGILPAGKPIPAITRTLADAGAHGVSRCSNGKLACAVVIETSGSWLIGAASALAYPSSLEVLVRSSYGGYFGIENFAILLIALRF